MSFNDMMQQAIKIRTSTDAKLRVDFDSKPKFQQTSLFATREVRAARDLPLEERLQECTNMKLKGNEQTRRGGWEEACHTYEQALAIFWYLDNRNEKWKTSGIKDEDICEVNFTPSEATEIARVRDLKVALLLNIARAYSAQKEHDTSRKACTAALAVKPDSAKALYWRAKGLLSPASSGAFETDEAVRDLSRAAQLAPGDKAIRVLLSKLRGQRIRQKEVDRATFAGMFRRGSVCDERAESLAKVQHATLHGESRTTKRLPRGEEGGDKQETFAGNREESSGSCRGDGPYVETRRGIEERVAFMERMAKECDEEDREDEAACCRERIAGVREALKQHDKDQKRAGVGRYAAGGGPRWVDWRNPTEEMRKKAADEELDLSNPAVIKFLVQMQENHQNKAKAGRRAGAGGALSSAGEENCGSARGDGSGVPEIGGKEGWGWETCEGAIRCMSRTEVRALLRETDVEQDPKMPLGKLRDLAVEKLETNAPPARSEEGPGNRKQIPKGESRRKASNWKVSMAFTLVIFLFKSYQMGLYKWLVNGTPPPAFSSNGRNNARRDGGRRGGRTPPSSTGQMTCDTDDRECDSLAAQALSAGSSSAPSSASAPPRSSGLLGGCTKCGAAGDGEDLDDEFGLLIDESGKQPGTTDRRATLTGTAGDRPDGTRVSGEIWAGDAEYKLGTLPGDIHDMTGS